MKKLSYFQSVSLPEDESISNMMNELEDILQQEHKSDGKHPMASESNAGFISPSHIQKIEAMWKWFQEQKSKR